MEIRSIGVIGAGQMGSGIAHVCALAGYDILIIDMSRALAEAGVEVVRSNMERQRRRGVIDQDEMDAALGRIAVVDSYAGLADCDCVIEAASENEKVKKEILAELTSSLKAEAIICTNTSSIPITRLAAATDRPEKFMGMHFMNPVPMMNLVELIRGLATDGETFDTIRALTLELGKVPANAEDFPAFIVNPYPVADDQRGGLCPLRGRRHRRFHRYGDAARRQPSHGPARNSPTSSASMSATPSCRCSL